MNINIIKIAITKFGIFFIALFFINCNDKEKKSDLKNLDSVSTQKEITNPPLDTVNLKEIINKRFSKIYDQKTIRFNDGSTMNFQEPLVFNKIKDNFKRHSDIDFKVYMAQFKLDSAGVLLENGIYHPTEIGKVALKAINNYKNSGSDYALKVFWDQVKWVETNFLETENYGFWYFTQSAPLYDLEPGWTSAFSQGTLLNVCLEAYRLTNDKKYATLIEKALKGFMVPIENGGFMRYWNENELWVEEYNTEKPSRVLNGTMYGLIGVYNVYNDLGLELAANIFESGVSTIKNHLEDFDAKFTSRYSLADWKNEVSKENYHEGHILQLLWFHKITKDPVFKKYAKIFLENDRGNFMAKTNYKLNKNRILNITASHTIDSINNGVSHLFDEIWAYGGFWSSYKNAELIIDFGEKKKDISAITLYHVNAKSKDVNFKLYSFDEDTKEWKYVQQFIANEIKDNVRAYNKTGNYETYIEHYKIFENADTRKIKLVFDASTEKIIAIREVNFVYDRSNDLDYLIKKMDEKL
jgi:hypothetical protein